MEDSADFQERIFDFIRNNFLVLALLVGGVVFLGIGLVQILKNNGSRVSDFKSTAEIAGAATSSSSLSQIQVDVEGAVEHPGVYSLQFNSRVQDALVAAGGLSSTANHEIIQKSVNLAQKVIDGQKIYIPSNDDSASGTIMTSDESNSSTSVNGGLVSINSATLQDLDSLPGVGPVTAQKIIDARPYNSLDDLVNKKSVGKSTFTKIQNLISL